jgi:hypothetical protein
MSQLYKTSYVHTDKLFQHVHRMEDNRLPKKLVNYHPKGRRQPGRPRKRLLDDMTAETETGHPGLDSWCYMMMMGLLATFSSTLHSTHAQSTVDMQAVSARHGCTCRSLKLKQTAVPCSRVVRWLPCALFRTVTLHRVSYVLFNPREISA